MFALGSFKSCLAFVIANFLSQSFFAPFLVKIKGFLEAPQLISFVLLTSMQRQQFNPSSTAMISSSTHIMVFLGLYSTRAVYSTGCTNGTIMILVQYLQVWLSRPQYSCQVWLSRPQYSSSITLHRIVVIHQYYNQHTLNHVKYVPNMQ